jgi:gliding motility-associated-like protein
MNLIATRAHNLTSGGIKFCSDTTVFQSVTVRDTMPASFTITPLGASCLPYAVQFNNTTNITTVPFNPPIWTFGEPVAQSGNPVSHTYYQLGQYNVNLTIVNTGNCTYIDSQKVTVAGPIGTWTHDTGYVCGNTPVHFQINASSTDSVTINYDDLTPVITVPFSTFPNPFTHVYAVGGNYTPTVTLKSVNGCTYFIAAFGTIRVDYVKAGYTVNTPTQNCGNTVQSFTNKTTMDQSPLLAAYVWNINGVTYNVPSPSVTFNTTGVYNVRMQVTSVSGCFDSVATAQLSVKVNNVPNILSITRQDTACAGQAINYTAVLSPSEDPITNYNWTFGNGQTASGISTQTIYGGAGTFSDNLTVVTSNGCTSNLIKGGLVINPTPTVSISPSTDTLICAGSSLTLTASGANTYAWSPNLAITPNTTSATVTVAPPNLTKYVVEGFNVFGCSDTSSIRVSTVNDYSITINASPNDSICKGDSITLKVVGAPASSSIVWSPSTGITTPTNVASVIVKPSFTTQYKVDVTDSAVCFPHNETIWVGVGDTTKINLGLDTVYLQGGTTLPLVPSIVNGPIATWNWTPATNLSCSDCENPLATVASNVCYSVEATSIYGCKASDKICIIAFCEASQVFIPNAFTPDGDGVNDYLWIKARGIKTVNSFRIFNRWGQVVFERANFKPVDYDKVNSWDGRFKGILAPTEVYVYTCEVVCENGTKFTYTGNIALIK